MLDPLSRKVGAGINGVSDGLCLLIKLVICSRKHFEFPLTSLLCNFWKKISSKIFWTFRQFQDNYVHRRTKYIQEI